MTTKTINILGSVAAVGLLLAPAAVASPDTHSGNNGAFLEQLNLTQAGIPGKSPDETVAAGYEACRQLRSGVSVLDEASAVERTYHFSQGSLFISAATTHLCPDFASGVAAPAPAAVHVEQYITGYCTPPNGQICNAAPSVHFDAAKGQRVLIKYTPDAHSCSDAIFAFHLDGQGAGAPTVGHPGQTISGVPMTIGATGGHDASLTAVGKPGGCNTGTLESWGGTLVVDGVA